jgi:divalent metal cation (Fe/Co/Zn/Cd) transporter
MDGVDPEIITTAEKVAAEVPGVRHAHARARWTGRTLRIEVEGWVDADTSVTEADQVGQAVADRLTQELPEMRSFAWTARGV